MLATLTITNAPQDSLSAAWNARIKQKVVSNT